MQPTQTAHRTLDADHAGAAVTFVLGAAALVLLAVSDMAAAWVGLIGVLVGGWSQFVSRTRPERFENVIGITMAAVALGVGLAGAGLTG